MILIGGGYAIAAASDESGFSDYVANGLAKLVEELTSNLENLQRQRRESDALLRNLRGELGMANKARKASEIQMENYRTSIRQLEEQSAIKNAENERLNEQLRGKVEDEAALNAQLTKKEGFH